MNAPAATALLQEAALRLEKQESAAVANHSNLSSSSTTNFMVVYWSLMLQKNLWLNVVTASGAADLDFAEMVALVVALFPEALQFHSLARKLKLQIAPFWFVLEKNGSEDSPSSRYSWFPLLEKSQDDVGESLPSQLQLLQLACKLCNGCEDNKKSFARAALSFHSSDVRQNGLERLVHCIPATVTTERDTTPVQEVCRLIAILGKFQPLAEPQGETNDASSPKAPTVSSAHANVKELHKANAVPTLHRLAKQQSSKNGDATTSLSSSSHSNSDLLCDALAALRVMAIDNDIVQNMIALGILDTIHHSLEVAVHDSSAATTKSACLPLATATFGLVRNLCANDEVKTSICKSSLPSILHVMQNYLGDKDDIIINNSSSRNRAVLQEHACGILGAMALRQPHNAEAIVQYGITTTNDDDNADNNIGLGGHVLILQAMKAYPEKTTLQRQGCLALRNIASRLSEADKGRILGAGAEDVIQNIAGRHPASSEEAYSALRDLGCNPVMWDLDESGRATTKSSTQMFGVLQSNFRAVYE